MVPTATPGAKQRKKPLVQGHGCDLSQGLELNSRPTRPRRLWLNQSQVFFVYINALGIILTTQAYADDNTEKPGHTFLLFLLVPSCVRQHWLYEYFYFLCQINFLFAKKDCIKIIRLFMEDLVTNKVGFFYSLCQTIFLFPMSNK